jgi:RNA polymerase sigma factor (sigma-70 family)
MIIPSIGKQKISYKDHSSIQFESLDFYLNLAQKIIGKMGPKFFNGLTKEMLKNDDAISFVANAIMMGDWRWDKDSQDKTKTLKNLYSYRNQCAIWAIKTYITKKFKLKHSKKNINNTPYSVNYSDDELNIENITEDRTQMNPVDIIILNEEQNIQSNLIKELLSSNILSEKQKGYIQNYYFDNMTLEKIGQKNNVTREAVRQSIKSGLSKIRKLVHAE